MIISRRKYEEAIEKACRQAEERLYMQMNYERMECNLMRRIDELEQRLKTLGQPHEATNERTGSSLPTCRV